MTLFGLNKIFHLWYNESKIFFNPFLKFLLRFFSKHLAKNHLCLDQETKSQSWEKG